MATLEAPRRKKVVYGKLSRPGFSTAGFFDDVEEDELATSQTTVTRPTSLKSTYPVQKAESKAHHHAKPARPPTKRDPFDILSSDEEVQEQRAIPQLPKYKPVLVDDTATHLAPWEKKRSGPTQQSRDNATRKRKTPEASPEAQLRAELARATASPESRASAPSTPRVASPPQHRPSPVASPGLRAIPLASSAVARLAALKRPADSKAPSSADEGSRFGRKQKYPAKRARTADAAPSRSADDDVVMEDAVAETPVDVFDLPDTSGDESKKAKLTMLRPNIAKANPRRGKLAANTRSTPRNGLSAPARLSDMVTTTDSDSTEAPTRSPSASISQASTPQPPSTPQLGPIGSPQTAVKAAGTVTPKQANLWNKLLPIDPASDSPSTLPIKDLSISSGKRSTATSFGPRLAKSQSDVGRRRTRLVDRLKASTFDSDGESSNDEESEGTIQDIYTVDQAPGTQSESTAGPPKLQRQTSHSQGPTLANIGPKITYSRVRSYLPEDNMEADLMLGLDVEPTQPSVASRRGISNQSQKSAFDMDESEDDGPGKIRSIHELRASGSNARGMGDIEDLMDDIAKHNTTQRGIRRTALINLATKLMDSAFKTRFVEQSFETHLVAECDAGPDDVSNFLLSACIALLLESDPQEHVLLSLQEGNISAWLAKHLTTNTIIAKLAKDRKNNVSKLSQGALLDFAEKLKAHVVLWGDGEPPTITPRIVSLKALDLLSRAMRRRGDSSALVGDAVMLTILRDEDEEEFSAENHTDLALSISVLESLSTAAVTTTWPSDLLQRVARLLVRPHMTTTTFQNSRFLALRLALNLTNDNMRNCALMSESEDGAMVHHLLRSIQQGYSDLGGGDADKKAINLDLLVLAIGIMINLSDCNDSSRAHALTDPQLLDSLIAVFQLGQKHMIEAESEEESAANVTFGYLAIMLANICRHQPARTFVASKLPGKNLHMLVEGVEEFVTHHQRVDKMNFDGDEGTAVWSAFTDRLKHTLVKLKEGEAAGA